MKKFFERVLPPGGWYSLLGLSKGAPLEVNGLQTIDDLVQRATLLSTGTTDVYYAVGTYESTGRTAALARRKRALFLDLDAKDFGDSKPETLSALRAFIHSVGLPPPPLVVDSGGGYHAYWPLAEDLDVSAWKALALALKARCDSCGFNADPTVTADAARVLRVPGTLNYKYNPPRPVVVVQDTGECFDPAVLFRTLAATKAVAIADTVLPQGNANAAINDDLSAGTSFEAPTAATVREMLKAIVIPAAGAARRKVWTDVLAAIKDWDPGEEGFQVADEWSATQPAYKDSTDVRKTWDSFQRDEGPRITIATVIKLARDAGWNPPTPEEEQDVQVDLNAEGYLATARRPDARAKEAVARGHNRMDIEAARKLLTDDFIYVENQGTYYSISRRNVLDKERIDDLNTWRMPLGSNGRALKATDILKNSRDTGVVHSLGFAPGKPFTYNENGREFVNRYVDPAAPVPPTKVEATLFCDLVDYLFPSGNEVFRKYWLQYMGHVVQRPAVKIATALLFISEKEGIGKTLALYEIPRLLVGIDNASAVTNDTLEGRFTSYLGNTHLLHLEEVHVSGHWSSSKIANKLKAIVTDGIVCVEEKGRDPYNIPNRLVVTATSNYLDAMHISSKLERRWGIYELAPARNYTPPQHRKYFDMIHRWLASDRAAGVLRYIFGNINLQGFNPQTPPPVTTAKQKMSVLSMSEECQVIHDSMMNQAPPFHRDLFQIDEIRGLLKTETSKVYSSKHAANCLIRVVPEAYPTRVRSGHAMLRVWCWREFEKWRGCAPEIIRAELERQ